MILVIDSNILISFFRDNPVRFIILNQKIFNLELFTPEYVLGELKKNESDVLKYGKINSEQFNNILSDLVKLIRTKPKETFKEKESRAKELIHDKDIPIFALALSLNCAIWSNEPAFKSRMKSKYLIHKS